MPDVDLERYKFIMTGVLFKQEPNIMAIPKPLMINFVQQSILNWNKCSTQNTGVIVVVVEAVSEVVVVEPQTQFANDMINGISSKNFIFAIVDFYCFVLFGRTLS